MSQLAPLPPALHLRFLSLVPRLKIVSSSILVFQSVLFRQITQTIELAEKAQLKAIKENVQNLCNALDVLKYREAEV